VWRPADTVFDNKVLSKLPKPIHQSYNVWLSLILRVLISSQTIAVIFGSVDANDVCTVLIGGLLGGYLSLFQQNIRLRVIFSENWEESNLEWVIKTGSVWR
jgi:hypothetical protein